MGLDPKQAHDLQMARNLTSSAEWTWFKELFLGQAKDAALAQLINEKDVENIHRARGAYALLLELENAPDSLILGIEAEEEHLKEQEALGRIDTSQEENP